MKRISIVFAILLALVISQARAHVLLSTPYSLTGPSGITACSAPHVTATSWSPTVNNGTVTGVVINYSFGTATFSGGVDTGWTTATCAPSYIFTLNFGSGQWTLSIVWGCIQTQVASGVMAGATLTTAISNYQNANTHQFNDDADQFLTVTGSRRNSKEPGCKSSPKDDGNAARTSRTTSS